MHKFIKSFVVFIFSAFMLAGCLEAPLRPFSAVKNENRMCAHLKHDMLMNSRGNNGPTEMRDNPAQVTQLYKAYNAAHCDEVLRAK